MRRTFVSVDVVFFVTACGMASIFGSDARAQDQLLDPGWRLASSDTQTGNGGFFGLLFGDEPRASAEPQANPSAAASSQRMPPRLAAPSSQAPYQYYVPAQQIRAYQRSAPVYGAARAAQEASANQQTAPIYGAAAPQSGYQAAPRYNPPRGLLEQLFARREPAQAPAYVPASLADPAHPAIDPQYERQVVDYNGNEKAGTIVIDTPHFFLYLVMADGKALRYGIGVGRPGFTWAGVKEISAMREWPDWIPPDEMLARRPDLPRFMPGGPDNPLGARALYLGSTLYRIHGSNEPWTIGMQVSSGCIRLRNEDVIDLYGRVKVGSKVIVL